MGHGLKVFYFARKGSGVAGTVIHEAGNGYGFTAKRRLVAGNRSCVLRNGKGFARCRMGYARTRMLAAGNANPLARNRMLLAGNGYYGEAGWRGLIC